MGIQKYKYSLLYIFSFYLVHSSTIISTPSAVKQSPFDECDEENNTTVQPTHSNHPSNPLKDLALVCSLEFHISTSKDPQASRNSHNNHQTDDKKKDDDNPPTHNYNLRSKKIK